MDEILAKVDELSRTIANFMALREDLTLDFVLALYWDQDEKKVKIGRWYLGTKEKQMTDLDTLIERLKSYTPEEYERTMKAWDSWRKHIAKGHKGSLPRDCFESHLDAWHEDAKEAAAALAELQIKYEQAISAANDWHKENVSLRERVKELDAENERNAGAYNEHRDQYAASIRKLEAQLAECRKALETINKVAWLEKQKGYVIPTETFKLARAALEKCK